MTGVPITCIEHTKTGRTGARNQSNYFSAIFITNEINSQQIELKTECVSYGVDESAFSQSHRYV